MARDDQYRWCESNYGARIKHGKMRSRRGVRTNTYNRDPGTLNASIVTQDEGGTTLKIYKNDFIFALDGHEARTVYRVLQKHFDDV